MKLNPAQIQELIMDGDRLADQGQFQEAVAKYTEGYMSVVADLRGQSFKTMVKPKLMNREELAKEMTAQIKTDVTPEELKLMEATFKVFGLAPESLNLEQTLIKLYTEEVGGFYDPKNKAMVLIHDDQSKEDSKNPTNRKPGLFDWFSKPASTFNKEEQKTTLAHELTHALQDQLYDLQSQTDLVSHDDDMSLAFSSLVEGDATLVMFADMGREDGTSTDLLNMDPQVAEAMFGMLKMTLPIASGSTYRTAPKIFRESLLFPYMNGMAYTMHLTRRDRFREVDKAFVSPPISTEQILHPEKYLIQKDAPLAVSIADAKGLLGTDWEHLGGNCMGEFQTSVLLSDVDLDRSASAGWDGDRYEVFQMATGERAVVWMSIWDSNSDADEFATAYQRYVDRRIRLESETVDSSQENSVIAKETSSGNRWKCEIRKNGQRVTIAQGTGAELAKEVLEKASQFTTSEKTYPGKNELEN